MKQGSSPSISFQVDGFRSGVSQLYGWNVVFPTYLDMDDETCTIGMMTYI